MHNIDHTTTNLTWEKAELLITQGTIQNINMKFNIALIPYAEEVSRTLIQLAEEVRATRNLKAGYLIKEPLSIPHISVIQFEIEGNLLSPGREQQKKETLLELIWKHVSEIWEELLKRNEIQNLVCILPKKIHVKHDYSGVFSGISWVELVINKGENPLIQLFHDCLLKRLSPSLIKPLNASGEKYNPHFTLFNVITNSLGDFDLAQEIPSHYFHGLQAFSVKPILGIANSNWELVKKLTDSLKRNILFETKRMIPSKM